MHVSCKYTALWQHGQPGVKSCSVHVPISPQHVQWRKSQKQLYMTMYCMCFPLTMSCKCNSGNHVTCSIQLGSQLQLYIGHYQLASYSYQYRSILILGLFILLLSVTDGCCWNSKGQGVSVSSMLILHSTHCVVSLIQEALAQRKRPRQAYPEHNFSIANYIASSIQQQLNS